VFGWVDFIVRDLYIFLLNNNKIQICYIGFPSKVFPGMNCPKFFCVHVSCYLLLLSSWLLFSVMYYLFVKKTWYNQLTKKLIGLVN
jgi:hypothetical protein